MKKDVLTYLLSLVIGVLSPDLKHKRMSTQYHNINYYVSKVSCLLPLVLTQYANLTFIKNQKSKLLLCFIFLLHEVLFLIYTFHFCYMFYYIVTSILFIFKFLLHITIFILFNFKFVWCFYFYYMYKIVLM